MRSIQKNRLRDGADGADMNGVVEQSKENLVPPDCDSHDYVVSAVCNSLNKSNIGGVIGSAFTEMGNYDFSDEQNPSTDSGYHITLASFLHKEDDRYYAFRSIGNRFMDFYIVPAGWIELGANTKIVPKWNEKRRAYKFYGRNKQFLNFYFRIDESMLKAGRMCLWEVFRDKGLITEDDYGRICEIYRTMGQYLGRGFLNPMESDRRLNGSAGLPAESDDLAAPQ